MRAKWTPLQKEQIEEGEKKGLNVRLYAKPCFNYRQMACLRKAMEAGLQEEQIRLFAHPWIAWEEMENILEDLLNKEEPKIPRRPVASWKWLLLLLIVPIGFLIARPDTEMRLVLTQEQVELSVLDEFDPSQYVQTWHGGPGDHLVLVDAFECRSVGTTLIPFRVVGASQTLTQYLRLRVVDHTAPVLELNQETLWEPLVDPLSCRLYVRSAYDETDGDLRDRVQCRRVENELRFHLSDLSGNETEAVLRIQIPQPEEEVVEEEPIYVSPSVPVWTSPVQEPAEQPVFEEQWESVQEWTSEVSSSETVVVLQ